MTRLLEQAIERLRTMPEDEQDRLAQFLINELEEDQRWAHATTTRSRDAIAAGSVAAATAILPPEDFSDWED